MFKDSSLFFYEFIVRNDIILDYNYDKILLLYIDSIDTVKTPINTEYWNYLNIFSNHQEYKSELYLIYYILVLYLIDTNYLRNFVRYVLSMFSKYNLINNKLNILYDRNKDELLIVLFNLINSKDFNINKNIEISDTEELHQFKLNKNNIKMFKLFLLILCFQNYF